MCAHLFLGHMTQQSWLSFAPPHVNHKVSAWFIITGRPGGAEMVGCPPVDELPRDQERSGMIDVADLNVLGYKIAVV